MENKRLIITIFNDLIEAGIIPAEIHKFLMTIDIREQFYDLISDATEWQCTQAINIIRQRVNENE